MVNPGPTYDIGDFNPTGPVLSEISVNPSVQGGLTTGPDGQVWFTGGFGGDIDPTTQAFSPFFGTSRLGDRHRPRRQHLVHHRGTIGAGTVIPPTRR